MQTSFSSLASAASLVANSPGADLYPRAMRASWWAARDAIQVSEETPAF